MVTDPGWLPGEQRSRPEDIRKIEHDLNQVIQTDKHNSDAMFVLGMIAFRDGRHDAAADYIRRAIAVNPTNAEYHYYLGAAREGLGLVDQALDSIQKAVQLNPGHMEAQKDLGRIFAGRGQFAEAVQCYRQAVQLKPDDSESNRLLGIALSSQGKVDEAERFLQQALTLHPGDGEVAKNLGVIHARRGRLDEAITSFRDALRNRPDDPDTLNDLGVALARNGRFDEAADCYRKAILLRPEFSDAHNNLGNTLRNKGRIDEAVASFREALRIRPNYPECHNNLAIALRRKGQFDEAVASYLEALRLRPNYAEAHNNLGYALSGRGKHDAAVMCFQQALRLKPDYVEAYTNLGNSLCDQNQMPDAINAYRQALKYRPDDPQTHKSLGNAFARQEKPPEAIASYQEALRLKPDFSDAHNDLGIIYARQFKFADAVSSYQNAIKHRSGYAEAHNNMANALRNLGRFAEALDSYRKAIELKPNYADAYNNQGITYAELGKFDEAVESYTQCLRLRPGHVDAQMNRALTWLRKGDYAQGWAGFEWRWKKRSVSNLPLIQPLWNGFPLTGRRILLLTEQGLGDTMQFIRYAPLLKQQGATVILECPEKLLKILSRCPGIDQIVPQGEAFPEYDVYAPLLTVPGLVGTSLERIPTEVPYIHPDPDLVEYWRNELADVREFKVGINWQGNPKYGGDYHRSIPLKHFAALAKVPGVRLFSVQKNDGTEQLPGIAGQFHVTDLGSRLDTATGPFMDTAAVMKNLDLFITSDTAVVHLAGGMGVPVWVALSMTPGWQWLTVREDSPWYPTMRLFRQTEPMKWEAVFNRISDELRKLVPSALRSRPVAIQVSPGELFDKIAALEINKEHAVDSGLRRSELASLTAVRERSIFASEALSRLAVELTAVHEQLGQIEKELQTCQQAGEYGPRFIELSRAAYSLQNRRADLKREIDLQAGSSVAEPVPDARIVPDSRSETENALLIAIPDQVPQGSAGDLSATLAQTEVTANGWQQGSHLEAVTILDHSLSEKELHATDTGRAQAAQSQKRRRSRRKR